MVESTWYTDTIGNYLAIKMKRNPATHNNMGDLRRQRTGMSQAGRQTPLSTLTHGTPSSSSQRPSPRKAVHSHLKSKSLEMDVVSEQRFLRNNVNPDRRKSSSGWIYQKVDVLRGSLKAYLPKCQVRK